MLRAALTGRAKKALSRDDLGVGGGGATRCQIPCLGSPRCFSPAWYTGTLEEKGTGRLGWVLGRGDQQTKLFLP